MAEDIILTQSEYERLLQEIHVLQARIIELTAVRDDLVYHVCPALQAEYEEKIASLERELLAAQMYLAEKQRILEILQAQMNSQKEPSFEEAEQQAGEEYRKYEDDLHKKAKEAKDFREHWEKDTQWSQHDREEKERAEHSKSENEDSRKTESKQQDGSDSEENKNTGESAERDGNTEEKAKDDFDGDSKQGGKKKESAAQELKRLYRKIVKRLHPDTHPNPTEKEKILFNRAVSAYQAGDLEAMRQIWEELTGSDPPEEKYADTPEDCKKLKELLAKLEKRLFALESEIRHIRSQFPYTMKSFLENDAAVEEKRTHLQKKIEEVRERDRILTEYINELKRKMSGETYE